MSLNTGDFTRAILAERLQKASLVRLYAPDIPVTGAQHTGKLHRSIFCKEQIFSVQNEATLTRWSGIQMVNTPDHLMHTVSAS